MLKRSFGTALFVTALLAAGTGAPAQAASSWSGQAPSLVITNEPLPADLQNRVYGSSAPSWAPPSSPSYGAPSGSPSYAPGSSYAPYAPTYGSSGSAPWAGSTMQHPVITPSQISGNAYFGGGSSGSEVSRKVADLRGELGSLQNDVSSFSGQLNGLQMQSQSLAAEYYASVATINTQLQSGTTPGNPRLVGQLDIARDSLEKLSGNVAALNDLALQITNAASRSSFLLELARAAYGLSGAVEEDHASLADLEDAVNSTDVIIERLLNNISDDITRTSAYLGTEHENLRVLSLAISTGDLFGKSLSNRPFSNPQLASFAPYGGGGGMMMQQAAYTPQAPVYSGPTSLRAGGGSGGSDMMVAPTPQPMAAAPAMSGARGARPLVKIRFDKEDVNYEQPVYMAVNEALARYPQARFELVAVHPSMGNAAEVAIESTRARRNAEKVLRSLTQMGLALDKIDLSYTPSASVTTSEVHLYVR